MSEEAKPRRIQRKRTKGWKMPDGAIYVGRPTKWGNPFPLNFKAKGYDREMCLQLFENVVRGYWSAAMLQTMTDSEVSELYKLGHSWRLRFSRHPMELLYELRGKDLACWCPLDQPCHADVLLEIANAD